jgi:hypothetical protein
VDEGDEPGAPVPAQPAEHLVRVLGGAADARGRHAAEEPVRIENERGGLDALARGQVEQRGVFRGPRLLPLRQAEAMRVDAGEHRGDRRHGPRRGGDRSGKQRGFGGEAIDGRRLRAPAAAAEHVGAQAIDEDEEQAHERGSARCTQNGLS